MSDDHSSTHPEQAEKQARARLTSAQEQPPVFIDHRVEPEWKLDDGTDPHPHAVRTPRIFARWRTEDFCFDAAGGGVEAMCSGFRAFAARVAADAPGTWWVHWGRDTRGRNLLKEDPAHRGRFMDLEQTIRTLFPMDDCNSEELFWALSENNCEGLERPTWETGTWTAVAESRRVGFWRVRVLEELLERATRSDLKAVPAQVFGTAEEQRLLAELTSPETEIYGPILVKHAAFIFDVGPPTIRRWCELGRCGKRGPVSPVERETDSPGSRVLIHLARTKKRHRDRLEKFKQDEADRMRRAISDL